MLATNFSEHFFHQYSTINLVYVYEFFSDKNISLINIMFPSVDEIAFLLSSVCYWLLLIFLQLIILFLHLSEYLILLCVLFGQSLICIQLFVTPWTVAHQAPLSTEFSRQEYWSRLSFPPPGDLPDTRTEPASPALAGRFFTIIEYII